ncbi:hypothetical protein TRVA0_011S01926 [Trichomonascus vanleenenianus]|uniref:mannose-ethanolamine phosphotransferase GPI11 n=1 Tax=Trichomonascus vanleenenianus TaxID=2268995 RepID=UPI003ECBA87D
MSSKRAKSSAAAAAESKASAKPHFRSSSNMDASKRLIHSSAYAVLLFSFLYLMFQRTLLDDPTRAMIEAIPFLAVIQIAYCVGAKLEGHSTPAASKKGKKAPESGIGTALSSAILAAVLSLILSALVFALLILFGAPLSSYVMETFLCAVHISLLSVQPLVYVYNLDSNIWRDIISVKLPLNGVYGASVGTWFGAWLGAIPIPLDWDRPWQQWPITILAGAYAGTALGTVVGAVYRKLKRD